MKHLKVGRVLHEDADFITVEIGKRDDVVIHLQQDENGETVGGDRFFTLIFVHQVAGRAETWEPWS